MEEQKHRNVKFNVTNKVITCSCEAGKSILVENVNWEGECANACMQLRTCIDAIRQIRIVLYDQNQK